MTRTSWVVSLICAAMLGGPAAAQDAPRPWYVAAEDRTRCEATANSPAVLIERLRMLRMPARYQELVLPSGNHVVVFMFSDGPVIFWREREGCEGHLRSQEIPDRLR